MIKKILKWALAPTIREAIDEYHETRMRDVLNEQIEGMVGECKEHAVATVQDYANRDESAKVAKFTPNTRTDFLFFYARLVHEFKMYADIADAVTRMDRAEGGRFALLQSKFANNSANRVQRDEFINLCDQYKVDCSKLKDCKLAIAVMRCAGRKFHELMASHVAGVEVDKMDNMEARIRTLENSRGPQGVRFNEAVMERKGSGMGPCPDHGCSGNLHKHDGGPGGKCDKCSLTSPF
jgi:hypothetical protein